MEIFHIGSAERRLIAIFYAGNEEKIKRTGIIICNPLGQEHIRFYKATVVLAKELSLQGFPTFRFDYYGTGDSYGDESEFNISSSAADLRLIVQELRDGCDIDDICLIGIRYGTILNTLYGHHLNISSHILWNPVISGTVYLNELKQQHQKFIAGSFIKTANVEKHERLGFYLSDQLIKDLDSFALSDMTTDGRKKVLVLADDQFLTRYNLVNYSFFKNDNLKIVRNDVANFWQKERGDQKSMVPVNEINQIINWLV